MTEPLRHRRGSSKTHLPVVWAALLQPPASLKSNKG
jgi:hypothetical protein